MQILFCKVDKPVNFIIQHLFVRSLFQTKGISQFKMNIESMCNSASENPTKRPSLTVALRACDL